MGAVSRRSNMSKSSSLGFDAGYRMTGILTRPKLIAPFHTLRAICAPHRDEETARRAPAPADHSCGAERDAGVTARRACSGRRRAPAEYDEHNEQDDADDSQNPGDVDRSAGQPAEAEQRGDQADD